VKEILKMKLPKFLLKVIVIISIGFPYLLYAQWNLINPLPFESEVESSFFTDVTTGWVTTRAGEIYITTDGGVDWIKQYSGNGESLLSIYFPDENLGFATGTNGIILKTTNSGNSWSQKFVEGVYTFFSLYFMDSDHGWVSGSDGKIYSTSDGGVNWIQRESSTIADLYKIQFVNQDVGYMVGWDRDSDIRGIRALKTIDGGNNWQTIYTSSNDLTGTCYFLNEYIGFLSIDGKIICTTDGGQNWSTCYEGNEVDSFSSITFSSSTDGWAVGRPNLIVHTSDGGITWEQIDTGIEEPLFNEFFSVFFASENIGWVFNSGRAFYKTTDKGITWINQSKDFLRSDLVSLYPINEQTLLALGGRIFKSVDGGFSWSSQEYSLRSSNKIKFYDSQTGWVLGTNRQNTPGYDLYNGILLKTINSGNNWEPIFTLDYHGVADFKDIDFVSQSTGWLTGTLDGVAYKTTDGGNNWILQGAEYPDYYSTLFFLDENYGFVGGNDLYKTTDGGNSWTKNSSISKIVSMYFFDQLTGFAVCRNSSDQLYKTDDGGNTWTKQNISSGTYLRKIVFINSSTGYIISNNSVFISTDQGNTWSKQVTPPHWYFTDIAFTNQNKGWVVGSRGFIMHTDNGGISSVDHGTNPLFKDYRLYQNYPNPFNPTTTIKFSIPNVVTSRDLSLQTKLIVYDILGREVKTLVNEVKLPGAYEVTFDASQLSSGVYFYKLTSGEFTQTRKVLLLK